MIVLAKASWLKQLLTLPGSIMTRIWGRLAVITGVSIAVTLSYLQTHPTRMLTVLPFTLIGLALSIFLGFRNNTSYDRFWEGRKLWGGLVNDSRSITRQILTLIVDPKTDGPQRTMTDRHRRMIHDVIAYIHALRLHLQGRRDPELMRQLVDAETAVAIESESNPPIAILQRLGDRMHIAWREGWIHDLHLPVLEGSLTSLTNLQGGCERIRATPIPFAYTVLMHRIVAVYCLGLPFGIVDTVGALTPVVVALVAYAFLGLDAIGDEIENPFDGDPNDLPLNQISRMIEINLRERLEEMELPPPITPDEYGLLT